MRLRLALPIFLALATPALAESLTGRASVIDGDTLEIAGTRVRLHGIDAPESGQHCHDGQGRDYRCGQRAALALADRIGTAPVSCVRRDTDRYGRTVATCRQGAVNLNAWMVAQGHAVAVRHYGLDYVEAEAEARKAGLGLWAGDFDMPWEWRHGRR